MKKGTPGLYALRAMIFIRFRLRPHEAKQGVWKKTEWCYDRMRNAKQRLLLAWIFIRRCAWAAQQLDDWLSFWQAYP
jgi:hypothetical protein